ncbi:thiamine phosphate synthase [Tanticharoenia sakaeratensis]|uniref:Thiamine-phosphate pyrophosphorylase n=1 Tax=Tanticharoenia sakaeratensis NBRC 103193 TaxID=1231623 RepID=A0A0D6MQF1_9PROT|nr:thiamine phosphate synthase [Tanticharoenia sakaeratensis]GAN55686.1 thiamine-phosphate pyrophosphorylase [Tanticharoenia sakaeratensis NBRC 103193]GBQ18643.1 thiamine monophosphate synthase [Tanticharoenia sakaeratensis NBRC 103193]
MPDCQLYITLPDLPDVDVSWIPATLADYPVAAVRIGTTDAGRASRLLAALREDIQSRDIALMLTDLPDLARTQNCDGAEVAFDVMPTADARRVLGTDRQLGVPCGESRDLAMQAGEDGADYVSFQGQAETVAALVGWWAGVAELPVVAMLDDAMAVHALCAAGADFIGLTLPETPEQARLLLDGISAALT